MKNKSLKKCTSCGATVKVIKDCECDNCNIKCCDKDMEVLTPNKGDSSLDKHVPKIEKKDTELIISMDHVMEDEHYIEFISYVSDEFEITKYFNPGDEVRLVVPYQKGAKVYAYCNKHDLYEKEID